MKILESLTKAYFFLFANFLFRNSLNLEFHQSFEHISSLHD